MDNVLDAEGKEPLSSGYRSHIATPPPSSPLQEPEEGGADGEGVKYPCLGDKAEDLTTWLESLPPTPSKPAAMTNPPIRKKSVKDKENITPTTSPSPSPSPKRFVTQPHLSSPVRTPLPTRFRKASKPHLALPPQRLHNSPICVYEDVPLEQGATGVDLVSGEQDHDVLEGGALDGDAAVKADEVGEQVEKKGGKVVLRGGAAKGGRDMRIQRADVVRVLKTLRPVAGANVTERRDRRRKADDQDLS